MVKEKTQDKATEYPRPLVKWVGGKRGILDALVAAMPEEYNDYWEPFVGGGALFFRLSPQTGHQVHLSDVNDDLMTTYRAVKSARHKLRARLDEMAAEHDEDYYYAVRAQHDTKGYIERAARFLFINKTCYNGLIRYNSKGQINTPWGHKTNPVVLYDRQNLDACAEALSGVRLATCSYEDITPAPGDFIYLDPPYDDTYNGYSKNGFGEEGQRALAAFCRKLDHEGVLWMLSNSDTPLIDELYRDFNTRYVTAPRAVSCKGDGRKPVREVLVTNYPAKGFTR